MNRGSVHDLVMNFKYMYEVQKYSRTNNNDTTEYYLASFLKDFGFLILHNCYPAHQRQETSGRSEQQHLKPNFQMSSSLTHAPVKLTKEHI